MAGVVPFDRSALKTNQVGIIGLLVIAYVTQVFGIVPLLALVMLVGAAEPRAALFPQLYFRVLKPAGLVRPRVVREDAAPHRFAQAVGGAVLVLSTLALYPGLATLGWALAWVVVALAFVNLVFDYCVGCQLYFLLARAGIIARR